MRRGPGKLTVCNACRYCEGLCPVWPAMERRTVFANSDLNYLANICHDCQACYPACPYTPPHDFAINIPKLLSEVRISSYQKYTPPMAFSRTFDSNKKWVVGASLASILLVGLIAITIGNPMRLLTPQPGSGSFYVIFPYVVIVAAGTAIGAYVVGAYSLGLKRFISDIRGSKGSVKDFRAIVGATKDALTNGGLTGGGAGCYHDEESAGSRRFLILHAMIFYGFASDLAATILAAIYQDALGLMPPYSFTSLPVILGIAGGVSMLVGVFLVALLKKRGIADAKFSRMTTLDWALLVNLALVSMTGLLVLALRDSAFLGIGFAVHIGLVLGLFVTAPYGKMVHFVYRYAALLINRVEERETAP